MPAIGGALAPDDVVNRAPRSRNVENTGLSTPADIEWNHCRFDAARATVKNAPARSGHTSFEKKATVMRSMSAAETELWTLLQMRSSKRCNARLFGRTTAGS